MGVRCLDLQGGVRTETEELHPGSLKESLSPEGSKQVLV